MKEVVRLLFLILTVLGTAGNSVSAMEPKPISIDEAVLISFQNNKNLRAAREQLESAKHGKAIARSNFFPRLEVEQTYIRTNQQVAAFGTTLNQGRISQADFNPEVLNDPDAITDYGTSVIVKQPLFNGGKEMLGYKMAGAGYEQATLEVKGASEEILFQTVKAYFDSLLAREGLKVSEEALVTAEKNLTMVNQQFAEGLVVKSDLLRVQVHTTSLREQLFTAEAQFQLAVAQLNLMLGDATGSYIPADKLEGGECPDLSLEELISIALQDRPDLAAFTFKEKIGELQLKMGKTGFLPNLNAQGQYDYHGETVLDEGADSYTVAVAFSLNLFNGTHDFYQVKQSKSNLNMIKNNHAAKRDMVILEVKKAYYDLQSAEKRLITSKEAVAQAEEGLRILEKRYQEGAAGIIDLLQAELGLSNAKFQKIRNRHGVLLNHALLAKAVGHLYTRWLEPEKCPVPDFITD